MGNKSKKNMIYDSRRKIDEAIANFNTHLTEGLYRDARKDLENLQNSRYSFLLWKLQSKLENMEYNFEKAKYLIDKCQSKFPTREKANNDLTFYIAIIYFTKGEFTIAKSYFEQLLASPSHKMESLKYLIYIEAIIGNYAKSYKLFSEIPFERRKTYRMQCVAGYLAYMLNEDILGLNPGFKSSFFYRQLSAPQDIILVSQMRFYYNGENTNMPYKQFSNDLDYYKLVSYLRREISSLKPTYTDFMKRYILKLSDNIGYIKNIPTSAVEVKALNIPGQIISIAPIQISSQFDKKKYLTRTRIKK